MLYLNRIYRSFFNTIKGGVNFLRIFHLKAKYPGIKVLGKVDIGSKTKIICTNGSSIILDNCEIKDGVVIIADHGGQISISKSYIGYSSVIVSRSKIDIGANCQIAEMVVIRDQNHKFGEKDKTIVEQGFTSSPIIIGSNVWLGAKVTVLEGTRIGENTVVGAHSVVRGELECNSVYVGTIAKKIKSL